MILRESCVARSINLWNTTCNQNTCVVDLCKVIPIIWISWYILKRYSNATPTNFTVYSIPDLFYRHYFYKQTVIPHVDSIMLWLVPHFRLIPCVTTAGVQNGFTMSPHLNDPGDWILILPGYSPIPHVRLVKVSGKWVPSSVSFV